jgi:hypothetical protein
MDKPAYNPGTVAGKAVDKSGACLGRHFTLVYPQLADRPVTANRTDKILQAVEY